MAKSVVVVGAGLAGMSCALDLAEAGCRVTVLESNPFLGGRTASWNQDGLEIESGFHRFLGFYEALPKLLERAGVKLDDILCWEDEIEIRVPDGGPSVVLGFAPLHKPLKTLAGMVTNNDWLTPADKLALGKFFAAAWKDYNDRPLELDESSVRDYAKAHDVSDRAIHNLLRPLSEIFFLPPERYSMFNLLSLFAPYAARLPKLRIGAFTGGMSDVIMRPLAEQLAQMGGQVLTGQEVTELTLADGRVTGVKAGQAFAADHVVLAASLAPAQKLITSALAGHAWFKPMLALPSLPLVTFQIELDQPAMPLDRTTFGPGTVLISFSEESRTSFQQSRGRLSIILPSDQRFIDMPAEAILELVTKDAKRLGLDLAGHVVDYRKVSLPDDFYSLEPGMAKLRPEQATPVPGLALAGDYTRQPYVGTMEGAVVSGTLAAQAVLAEK
ncbi:MAG TPA: FAD-dependent oxidoreductase [Candidatus Saccharimonadales bacterium]|nr:FAD-dependent oxidoreductase [Candidatus Saccharimonadales bacterium]